MVTETLELADLLDQLATMSAVPHVAFHQGPLESGSTLVEVAVGSFELPNPLFVAVPSIGFSWHSCSFPR